jgi:hypothetical protein
VISFLINIVTSAVQTGRRKMWDVLSLVLMVYLLYVNYKNFKDKE